MSHHLMEDQFAKCTVSLPAGAELKHLAECTQCSAELERFGDAELVPVGSL